MFNSKWTFANGRPFPNSIGCWRVSQMQMQDTRDSFLSDYADYEMHSMEIMIYKCPEHDWVTMNAGQYCPYFHGYDEGPLSLENRERHPNKERHVAELGSKTKK